MAAITVNGTAALDVAKLENRMTHLGYNRCTYFRQKVQFTAQCESASDLLYPKYVQRQCYLRNFPLWKNGNLRNLVVKIVGNLIRNNTWRVGIMIGVDF